MSNTLKTFTWEPSYTLSSDKELPSNTLNYSDSYVKNSVLGLNAPFISLNLKFENIDKQTILEIHNFLSSLGGEPFNYFVPFYEKSFIFSCDSWEIDVDYNDVFTLKTKFKEVFYYKAPAISNNQTIKLNIDVYNAGQLAYSTTNINNETYINEYGNIRYKTDFTYLYSGNLDYVYNGHTGQFNGKLHENYINVRFEPTIEYPFGDADLWMNVGEIVWTDASFIIEYIGENHYITSPRNFNSDSSANIFDNRFCDIGSPLSGVTGMHCWSGIYNFSNKPFIYNTGNKYSVFNYSSDDDIIDGKKSLHWIWLARLKSYNSVNIYMWNKSCRPECLFFSGGLNIVPIKKEVIPPEPRSDIKSEIFEMEYVEKTIPYISFEETIF